MAKRQRLSVATSDDNVPPLPPPPHYSIDDEDEQGNNNSVDEEDEMAENPKIKGHPIGSIGGGRWMQLLYKAFKLDGFCYELEDTVILNANEEARKPSVAIIKEILVSKAGDISINAQWFYRPEDAEMISGGKFISRDSRELFYSFGISVCPAESVLHKCVVHFIPLHKQIPSSKVHPGFIVQKVYDTRGNRLFGISNNIYEHTKQKEIDLHLKKTLERIGYLPNLQPKDPEMKLFLRKKRIELEDENASTSVNSGARGKITNLQKHYNQKMSHLVFNDKTNPVLSKRFLNWELEPSEVRNMYLADLKRIHVRCTDCFESKVGLDEIDEDCDQGSFFQLHCIKCGKNWYTSRDDAIARRYWRFWTNNAASEIILFGGFGDIFY